MMSWFTWPLRVVSFVLWYAREFLAANVQVIADVLRATSRMRTSPAIVAVPAASRSNGEWMLIATLITLTPGTLTITFSRAHRLLYVHGMFVSTREALVDEIQEMEDRLLRAMRRVPGDLSRPTSRPVPRPSLVDDASTDGPEMPETEDGGGAE